VLPKYNVGLDDENNSKRCTRDPFRYAAGYDDRSRPGDLPVRQAAVNYSLAINLKIAKALGLTVPLAMLGRGSVVLGPRISDFDPVNFTSAS
jgi:hypothetical protein